MKSNISQILVTLESPKKILDENQSNKTLLSLYIYRIVENSDLRNSMTFIDGSSKIKRFIALDIHFLLIPYGADADSILKIFGRTQQIMQSTVLSGSLLLQSLEGEDLSIKITQQQLSQELITQMWQALECSMRLALYYLATPIIIDLEKDESVDAVKDRKIGKGE
ncbi:DUF4255 domain-containing protein [bacterium]|nr:DUF4255 domain-containing protein [candidate division CSSED10-310 bacterium]